MNAIGAYTALTGEQKRVLHAKALEGQYDPGELVALLGPLGAFDRSAGRLRKWLVGLAIAFAVAGFFVISIAGLAGWLLWVAAAACVALYLRLRGVDLSDNLWSVAIPFLAVLREEMAPGARVDLKLDLTRPTEKHKHTHDSDPYTRGAYSRIVDQCYLDPWFEGRAELADRSRLAWQIEDRVIVSKRRKTSRGKTKLRTKHRKRSRLLVEVGLPGREYDVSTAAPVVAGTRAAVESGDKRTTFTLVRVVKQASLDPIDLRALVDLVAEAYKRAAPSRKGGAA